MTRTTFTVSAEIEKIFGRKGLLASTLPNYEYREGQCHMADAVRQAIQVNRHLIVEAGTGTGKSLAYLVPAIVSGKRTIVTTLTKNLQEQLYFKDIPFLQKHCGFEFQACNMKGRANYLCLRRFNRFLMNPLFEILEEAKLFDRLEEWARTTQTGDRAELDFVPDNYNAWSSICSSSESCTGKKCVHNQNCFFEKVRLQARNSQLIIINHHLYFADLSIKKVSRYAGVLPEAEVLIIDEAHEIEEVATGYFGLRFSSWQMHRLVTETERTLGKTQKISATFGPLLDRIDIESKYFFDYFKMSTRDKNRVSKKDWTQERLLAYNELSKTILRLIEELKKAKQIDSEEIPILVNRWSSILDESAQITGMKHDDHVYWVEQAQRTLTLASAPIDLSGEFAADIFQKTPSVILTSATLATDRSFTFFKGRIGLENCLEKIVESPFDFKEQALLYVPSKAPDPRDAEFDQFVNRAIEQILRASNGKAFVLFTSHRRMRSTHEALAAKLPFTCLRQGEKPKHLLIEEFKQETNSALFATASFWHGVDVVGQSLSVVIIDKIPFAVPDEPIIQARIELIEKRGGNPFFEFTVPSAVITLKQGFGRLIRSRSDFGLLVLLDRRFLHSGYAKIFQNSLPPVRITTEWQDAEQMCRKIRQHENQDRRGSKKDSP